MKRVSIDKKNLFILAHGYYSPSFNYSNISFAECLKIAWNDAKEILHETPISEVENHRLLKVEEIECTF